MDQRGDAGAPTLFPVSPWATILEPAEHAAVLLLSMLCLVQGFIMMTITLAVMAGTYNTLRANAHWAFIFLCEPYLH